MNSFLFLGGDLRTLYAARYLNKKYPCYLWGFENYGKELPVPEYPEGLLCEAAVLPLPASADGLHINAPFCGGSPDLYLLERVLKKGGAVFTPKSFPLLDEICARNGFSQENYFAREELQLMNAVPTAEGALEIMIRELPVTVFGASVLITGFGRIGKTLARYLKALGAEVTVGARRREQLAEAQLYGCRAAILGGRELDGLLPGFDVILNTVPAVIFDESKLRLLRSDCVLIELASSPCVKDGETAGVRIIKARSLPGKTAPVTAGEIIGKTVENILEERRC